MSPRTDCPDLQVFTSEAGRNVDRTDVLEDLLVRSHARTVPNAQTHRKCQMHSVTGYRSPVEPSDRLKQARERAGYDSARSAATAMGVSADTYAQHENGTRGFKSKAERYARFFKVAPEWLLFGRGDGAVKAAPVPINREVPVLGEVQAGRWHPVPDNQPEPTEFIPIVLPGFETAQLFALRVLGPSMNRYYPEGTIVVCCPVAEIGVRSGDHVIVEDRKAGMVETTVKEVVQDRSGIALWPRSDSADHQQPTRWSRTEHSDDGIAITAVVVSSYVIRPVQRQALLTF